MRRSAIGIIAACALAGLGLARAEAQTPGGQTGVRTEGSGRPAPASPDAGSDAGGVSGTPVIGAGANGNGGVMTGTTGTSPAAGDAGNGAPKPTAGSLDGVASGKAPP